MSIHHLVSLVIIETINICSVSCADEYLPCSVIDDHRDHQYLFLLGVMMSIHHLVLLMIIETINICYIRYADEYLPSSVIDDNRDHQYLFF